MTNKRLGIIFLAAVILSFLTGYFASDLFPFLPYGEGDELFDYISETFDNYYYYELGEDDLASAYVAQIEAIVATFGDVNDDPYTRIEAIPINLSPSGDESYVGIGISYVMDEGALRVVYVHHEAPADGLIYPNDLIIGVVETDRTVYFKDLETDLERFGLLSASEGETKTFVVMTPDEITHEVDLTYQMIETPTAYTLDLEMDDVAYIRINQFSGYQEDVTPGTAKVFSDLLVDLEASFLLDDASNKTLLIDLRDNPGGALSALHNEGQSSLIPGIIQQLLPRDIETTLFEMIPRTGEKRSFFGGLSEPKPYQIALLVNEHSASAAEVLAAAMSSYGGYPLYGVETYGKGVYQNQVVLADIDDIRYMLVYTEGIWTYDDGKTVNTDPLAVDEVIQTGILSLNLPVYEGDVVYDEVNLALAPFQAFLAHVLDLSIRTDGYFDLATRDALLQFQAMKGIEESGRLDIVTARAIHDHYMMLSSDPKLDLQLQDVLDMIGSSG